MDSSQKSLLPPSHAEILEWAEETPFNKISKWKYVVGGFKANDSVPNFKNFVAVDTETLYFMDRSCLSKWKRKIRKYDVLKLNVQKIGRGAMDSYGRHVYPVIGSKNHSAFTNIVWDGQSRFYIGDELGTGYYVFDLKMNEGWFNSFFGNQILTKVNYVDETDIYFSNERGFLFKVSMLDRTPKELGKFPTLLEAEFTKNFLSVVKICSKFYICHPSNSQIFTFCELRGFEPVPNVVFANPLVLEKDKFGGLLVLDKFGIHRVDLLNFLKISLPKFINNPKMFVQGTDLKVDGEGNIYISTSNTIVYKERDRKPRIVLDDYCSQGVIMCLENQWKRLRLLWIGKLKENWKTCFLALLPREIVKEVIAFV